MVAPPREHPHISLEISLHTHDISSLIASNVESAKQFLAGSLESHIPCASQVGYVMLLLSRDHVLALSVMSDRRGFNLSVDRPAVLMMMPMLGMLV